MIRRDVEAVPQAARPSRPGRGPSRPHRPGTLAAERIPHTRMRKTIAQRMVQAKQAAPEIHVTVDIRVDALVAIRERLNKQLAAEKIKLSARRLRHQGRRPGPPAPPRRERLVRARRDRPPRRGQRRHRRRAGRGPDRPGPPQRRHAGPPRDPARQRGPRAEAARSDKLTPEQMTGGTFTISNLGMYGVRQFDAILNLPEVGILAVGAAEKRPVVVRAMRSSSAR